MTTTVAVSVGATVAVVALRTGGGGVWARAPWLAYEEATRGRVDGSEGDEAEQRGEYDAAGARGDGPGPGDRGQRRSR